MPSKEESKKASKSLVKIGVPIPADTFSYAVMGHELYLNARLKLKRGSKTGRSFTRTDYVCATHMRCEFYLIMRIYLDEPNTCYLQLKKKHCHDAGRRHFKREAFANCKALTGPGSEDVEKAISIFVKNGWGNEEGDFRDPLEIIFKEPTIVTLAQDTWGQSESGNDVGSVPNAVEETDAGQDPKRPIVLNETSEQKTERSTPPKTPMLMNPIATYSGDKTQWTKEASSTPSMLGKRREPGEDRATRRYPCVLESSSSYGCTDDDEFPGGGDEDEDEEFPGGSD